MSMLPVCLNVCVQLVVVVVVVIIRLAPHNWRRLEPASWWWPVLGGRCRGHRGRPSNRTTNIGTNTNTKLKAKNLN